MTTTTTIKRLFTTVLISLCVLSTSINIFAGSSEPNEFVIDVENIGEEESVIEIEEVSNISGTPLTPNGNLTLVDDITTEDESSKQFITAISKNGNYFYLVIDRDGSSENVYLLNLVDEADLFALMGEDYEPPKEEPEIIIVEKEPEPEPVIIVVEPEEPEKSTLSPFLILILLLAGGGAFYYFKFIKPKSNDNELALVDYDDEDDDFYDDEDDELEE